MEIIKQEIPDVLLINPKILNDKRGYFMESFRQDLLESEVGYKINFIQDNESQSKKGVLRGLHYQIQPFAQSKLIRVIHGSVLDIVVDIRKNSPFFGKHLAIELNDIDKQQLFIPKGFAHGFVVLSDSAIFNYKVDNYYKPECEKGIAFDDNELGIDWRISMNSLKLSEKDKNYPTLSELPQYFS